MSVAATIAVTATIAGVSIAGNVTRNGESPLPLDTELPAGKAGTLTTRTDNDTGIVTVASGHGITTSDKVSLFWAGASRQGMTVTATSATTISVDVGTGTSLPAASTAVVVGKDYVANVPDFDSTLLMLMIMSMSKRGSILATYSGSDGAKTFPMGAGEPFHWAKDDPNGTTNPFTSFTVITLTLSNGDVAANRVKGMFQLDSVTAL